MSEIVCILSQEAALAEIEVNLGHLKKVVLPGDASFLHDVTKAAKQGSKEVEGDGLTMEICAEVSKLMLDQEAKTRQEIEDLGVPPALLREHVQLMLLHSTMARISLSQNMNEGQKPCEPYC